MCLDGQTTINPRLIPSARRRFGRNHADKSVPIAFTRDNLYDSDGLVNALWNEPYSLPQSLVIRDLDPGKHTLTLKLLGFTDARLVRLNSLSSKNRTEQNDRSSRRNRRRLLATAGKFKVLGLIAC